MIRMPPGRNEPCPCGSGRKFKHCCGAIAQDRDAQDPQTRNRGVAADVDPAASLERQPDRVAAALSLVQALVEGGRWADAAKVLRDALASVPQEPRLHATFAHVALALGDHRGAIDHGRAAVAGAPSLPEAHLNLGNALFTISELHAAETAYRSGLRAAPDHPQLRSALAMTERALGRLDDAEMHAREALALRPGAAEALALVGSLAADRGRFDEAETFLRQALAANPRVPEALVAWTRIRKMSAADAPWREAAEQALAAGLPASQAITLYHALGKYHDDLGRFADAFECHRRGNDLARRSRPRYDRARTTARVSRTLAAFERAALTALAADGIDSPRPLFVVGMPRSGTSLVEQILASHPEVHGAGELLFWNLAAEVERGAPPERRAATIRALGHDYLALLSRLAPSAQRVVDKMPANLENLGLIHAALPGARIIHVERNPVDTALSIYFQGLSHAHAYATDFDDIVHHGREYRRLIAHWRAALPAATLLEIRYEAMTADPETWVRRMLAHAGLPWDARCLEFHRTDRPVLTASGWQVRQPIGRGSVGRWRRYEPFIRPLLDALGEHDAEPSPR